MRAKEKKKKMFFSFNIFFYHRKFHSHSIRKQNKNTVCICITIVERARRTCDSLPLKKLFFVRKKNYNKKSLCIFSILKSFNTIKIIKRTIRRGKKIYFFENEIWSGKYKRRKLFASFYMLYFRGHAENRQSVIKFYIKYWKKNCETFLFLGIWKPTKKCIKSSRDTMTKNDRLWRILCAGEY